MNFPALARELSAPARVGNKKEWGSLTQGGARNKRSLGHRPLSRGLSGHFHKNKCPMTFSSLPPQMKMAEVATIDSLFESIVGF